MDISPIAIEQPDPKTRRQRISCKQELIVSSLQRFYSQRTDIAQILEILNGANAMSLRLIDWFVTNYSKVNNTAYILNGHEFVVYTNYKAQLKAYSKKLFDPFCRRERIIFQVPGHEPFMTTVGKLNFFRWAIEKGILDHIQTHQKEIEKHMNECSRELTKQRTTLKQSKTTGSAATAGAAATSSGTQLPLATISQQTRRRVGTAAPPNSKLLQKHECTVEMRFD
jgi:hypothetical protein